MSDTEDCLSFGLCDQIRPTQVVAIMGPGRRMTSCPGSGLSPLLCTPASTFRRGWQGLQMQLWWSGTNMTSYHCLNDKSCTGAASGGLIKCDRGLADWSEWHNWFCSIQTQTAGGFEGGIKLASWQQKWPRHACLSLCPTGIHTLSQLS